MHFWISILSLSSRIATSYMSCCFDLNLLNSSIKLRIYISFSYVTIFNMRINIKMNSRKIVKNLKKKGIVLPLELYPFLQVGTLALRSLPLTCSYLEMKKQRLLMTMNFSTVEFKSEFLSRLFTFFFLFDLLLIK